MKIESSLLASVVVVTFGTKSLTGDNVFSVVVVMVGMAIGRMVSVRFANNCDIAQAEGRYSSVDFDFDRFDCKLFGTLSLIEAAAVGDTVGDIVAVLVVVVVIIVSFDSRSS